MAAAAATKRLRIGTGVCLVAERDPIVTAKAAASVDRLSGGRLLFGVGAGWNLEEMRNHGTDPERRFGIMRERVEAIKTIWTEDEASYHGRHVDFDRSGAGRSRSRSRTRRSSSAATAARSAIACSPSATSGCRTGSATTTGSSPGSSACATPRREAGRGEIGVTLCNVPARARGDRALCDSRGQSLRLLARARGRGRTRAQARSRRGDLGRRKRLLIAAFTLNSSPPGSLVAIAGSPATKECR